jgi:hypothetical protein
MPNDPQIRLEVLHIDSIKPRDCRVREKIEFGEAGAEDVRATISGDECFKFVEGSKQRKDAGFVAFLGAGEAGLVDTGVDVRLKPGTYFVDL